MSFEIDTAFVKSYEARFTHLVQQMQTKLRGSVVEGTVDGEVMFAEQIGAVEMVQRTARHADTPLVMTPHRRRAITPIDYEVADLVDTFDKLRLKIAPESAYSQAQAQAVARRIDRTIIAAFGASAMTGKEGTTAVALPATQIIQATGNDAGNSGGTTSNLTIQKLRRAKFILDNNNVPDDDRHIAIGASQLQSLLTTTAVTSQDFNTVRALVNGELNTFLGFTFHMFGTGMLDVAGSPAIRDCYAWHKTGMELRIAAPKVRISERGDKSYSLQVYACVTLGSTRLEEEKVVKIQCNEAVVDGDVET